MKNPRNTILSAVLLSAAALMQSVPAAANESALLLDASCKIRCWIGSTEVDADQGGPSYEQQYDHAYADFIGLNRKQIDVRLFRDGLTKRCKAAFHSGATMDTVECLYFKH